MSAQESKLSDARYGYDVVVAVTQKSINTTLKQYLAGLSGPVIKLCFVYDQNNDIVPIDLQTLVNNAKGSDPFSVPNGANVKTNQDLINLADANFAGAVKASIGLPQVPPASIPPIVVLGHGASAPAAFNLLCSEFQITGFAYGARGMASWINLSQPTDPTYLWYFAANVDLNITTIDPRSQVPPAVQQRIIQLQKDPANAFTIQKLFLDLDTAILLATPTLQGVPPGWAVWNLITTMFLGAYLQQLRQTGDPVLGYSFVVKAPRPSTLQLRSITRECLPLLNNGQPIPAPTPAELTATALVYTGSMSEAAPVPVPFSWNWIELASIGSFSGVQAVRRDLFFSFLAGLANRNIGSLCYDSTVKVVGSRSLLTPTFSTPPAASPSMFRPVAQPLTIGADGFTKIFDLNFSHPSHGYDWVFTMNLNIDFNYTLTGEIAISQNQIRVVLHPQVYMKVKHLEVFVTYTDLPGANYYDKTRTILYTLGVDQNGAIQVDETATTIDSSAAWNLHLKGLATDQGFTAAMTSFESLLGNTLNSTMDTFDSQLEGMINGYQGWVFPGNDAFTFKNVGFSSGYDLITELTYVNPN
jgi:hypothetical protein